MGANPPQHYQNNTIWYCDRDTLDKDNSCSYHRCCDRPKKCAEAPDSLRESCELARRPFLHTAYCFSTELFGCSMQSCCPERRLELKCGMAKSLFHGGSWGNGAISGNALNSALNPDWCSGKIIEQDRFCGGSTLSSCTEDICCEKDALLCGEQENDLLANGVCNFFGWNRNKPLEMIEKNGYCASEHTCGEECCIPAPQACSMCEIRSGFEQCTLRPPVLPSTFGYGWGDTVLGFEQDDEPLEAARAFFPSEEKLLERKNFFAALEDAGTSQPDSAGTSYGILPTCGCAPGMRRVPNDFYLYGVGDLFKNPSFEEFVHPMDLYNPESGKFADAVLSSYTPRSWVGAPKEHDTLPGWTLGFKDYNTGFDKMGFGLEPPDEGFPGSIWTFRQDRAFLWGNPARGYDGQYGLDSKEVVAHYPLPAISDLSGHLQEKVLNEYGEESIVDRKIYAEVKFRMKFMELTPGSAQKTYAVRLIELDRENERKPGIANRPVGEVVTETLGSKRSFRFVARLLPKNRQMIALQFRRNKVAIDDFRVKLSTGVAPSFNFEQKVVERSREVAEKLRRAETGAAKTDEELEAEAIAAAAGARPNAAAPPGFFRFSECVPAGNYSRTVLSGLPDLASVAATGDGLAVGALNLFAAYSVGGTKATLSTVNGTTEVLGQVGSKKQIVGHKGPVNEENFWNSGGVYAIASAPISLEGEEDPSARTAGYLIVNRARLYMVPHAYNLNYLDADGKMHWHADGANQPRAIKGALENHMFANLLNTVDSIVRVPGFWSEFLVGLRRVQRVYRISVMNRQWTLLAGVPEDQLPGEGSGTPADQQIRCMRGGIPFERNSDGSVLTFPTVEEPNMSRRRPHFYVRSGKYCGSGLYGSTRAENQNPSLAAYGPKYGFCFTRTLNKGNRFEAEIMKTIPEDRRSENIPVPLTDMQESSTAGRSDAKKFPVQHVLVVESQDNTILSHDSYYPDMSVFQLPEVASKFFRTYQYRMAAASDQDVDLSRIPGNNKKGRQGIVDCSDARRCEQLLVSLGFDLDEVLPNELGSASSQNIVESDAIAADVKVLRCQAQRLSSDAHKPSSGWVTMVPSEPTGIAIVGKYFYVAEFFHNRISQWKLDAKTELERTSGRIIFGDSGAGNRMAAKVRNEEGWLAAPSPLFQENHWARLDEIEKASQAPPQVDFF